MNHLPDLPCARCAVERPGVGQVCAAELELRQAPQQCQACRLQRRSRRSGGIVQTVDPEYALPPRRQRLRDMDSHEPGGAGDQNAHARARRAGRSVPAPRHSPCRQRRGPRFPAAPGPRPRVDRGRAVPGEAAAARRPRECGHMDVHVCVRVSRSSVRAESAGARPRGSPGVRPSPDRYKARLRPSVTETIRSIALTSFPRSISKHNAGVR